MLYGYSIPAYYGKGSKVYLVAKCNVIRNLDFWLSATTSIKNPIKKNAKPTYSRVLTCTPFEVERAVRAHAEQMETHIP